MKIIACKECEHYFGISTINYCNHPDCFKYKTKRDPIYGECKERVRKDGYICEELNKNNDCERFEKEKQYVMTDLTNKNRLFNRLFK